MIDSSGMSEGIDLLEDFRSIVSTFEAQAIDYAVVGALALAIHGFPRATTDIDFLVQKPDLPRILTLIEPLGYRFPASGRLARAARRQRRVADMSPAAVERRLRRVSQLRDLCRYLMRLGRESGLYDRV